MKPIQSVLVAALAAAGLAASAGALAQSHGGSHGGGGHGGGGHWSGGSHFSGGHSHWSGGHGRFWGPSFGFYLGAPLLYSPWYWGYPYPYDYYYPGVAVERYVEPYPQAYPDGVMQAPPTTEVPRTEGAPTQGPAYMNYCESSKAYFPKVTSCPEGWKFVPAR